MTRPPTPAELKFVGQRTRPVVRGQRPRLAKYWGYPTNTVAPTISGAGTVGQILVSTLGTWKPSGVTLTRQWLRNGAIIAGATSTSYTLVAADSGTNCSCQVTGANPTGSSSAVSNAIAVA